VKLDPPVGIAMAGYRRRTGHSTGIHDDLSASALVISDGTRKAAIVSVEVLALGIRICDSIAEQVAAHTDIPPEAVMVCATHTHSGPHFNIFATPRGGSSADASGRDLDWERGLPDRIARAVVEANTQLRPAAVAVAGTQFGLGTNRRLMRADGTIQLAPNYAGAVDHELKVLGLFATMRGPGAIAFMLNYPCHGVVLCEDNLLYSRDWPGFAIDALQESTTSAGRSPIALFTQGAGGNIDPVRRGDFSTGREWGRAAASLANGALARAARTGSAPVVARRVPVLMKLRDLSARLAIARANAQQTELALKNHAGVGGIQQKRLTDQHLLSLRELAAVEALEDANRRDRRVDQGAGELRTHMTLLAMGELALVGVPGELFAELGIVIKANPYFPHTLVLGYCNDLVGYIPTREAYEVGGYEVETSRVAQGSGELLVHLALAHLAEMRQESQKLKQYFNVGPTAR
jgi:neutral ceramidase